MKERELLLLQRVQQPRVPGCMPVEELEADGCARPESVRPFAQVPQIATVIFRFRAVEFAEVLFGVFEVPYEPTLPR